MAIIVSFMKPEGLGNDAALGIGLPRACDIISVGETTSVAALDGEIVVICSTEAATVLAAIGLTPDGDATAATNASTAAFPLPPGVPYPVAMRTGFKVAVAAVP